LVAVVAVLAACLRAVCWRPRALPPAFAARLRDAALCPLLPDALLLLREEEEVDLPRDEEDVALLRADDPLPAFLRVEEPPLRDEELREDELRDDALRDDPPDLDDPPLRPPLDFRFDSAISQFLLHASVRAGTMAP
jgi:hypothetical protein